MSSLPLSNNYLPPPFQLYDFSTWYENDMKIAVICIILDADLDAT